MTKNGTSAPSGGIGENFLSTEFGKLCKAVAKASDALRATDDDELSNSRGNNAVPRCVVVGPQSAGKSMVLSTLCNIALPSNDGRCTRIAIEIKMEREPSEPPLVQVRVKGSHAGSVYNELIGEASPETADTAEWIRAAQQFAMETVGLTETSGGFVESMVVEVVSRTQDGVNLILVDLPGLLAPKAEDDPDVKDPGMVERIVNHYCKLEGSIILYIVPADQDPETYLGKQIVARYTEKTIIVLNKWDNVRLEEAESKLAKAARLASPRVIVSAKIASEGHEENFFNQKDQYKIIKEFEDEFYFGCGMLLKIVSERFGEHLRAGAEKLRLVLQSELKKYKEELSLIETWRPSDVMQRLTRDTLAVFDKKQQKQRYAFFSKQRERVDRSMRVLRPLPIGAAKSGNDLTFEMIRSYNLFDGASVWVENPEIAEEHQDDADHIPEWHNLVKATIQKKLETGLYECALEEAVDDDEEPTLVQVHASNIYVAGGGICNMLQDLRDSAQEFKDLRDLENVDVQLILDAYAGHWSSRYKRLLDDVFEACYNETKNNFLACFSEENNDSSSKKIFRAMRNQLLSELDKLHVKGKERVVQYDRYNKGKLVFTSYKGELSSSIERNTAELREALRRDPNGHNEAADSAALNHFVRLNVYIESQIKFIIESASKDLTLLYCEDADDLFKSTVSEFNKFEHVMELGEEPKERISQRAKLRREIKPLEEALHGLGAAD